MKRESARSVQILKTLKDEILTGRYVKLRTFPSEVALSRRFGVSRSMMTIVVGELEKQGFVSRMQGRGTFVTNHGNPRKIGLLVPGIAYCEIYPPIVSEISRLAQVCDYKLLIGDIPCATARTRMAQAMRVAKDIVRDRVAGVIYQPIEDAVDADECNHRILSLFADAGIPVVLIGYDVVRAPGRSDYDIVGINNFDAGFRIARHLVGIGVKRIHFFKKKEDSSPSCSSRILGIASALGPRRFTCEKNILATSPEDKMSIRRYIRRNSPEAFICANDSQAAAFRRTLEDIGFRVPNDLLLTGFDDVNIARLTGLTSVRQPCEGIARAAFRRLLERIKSPEIEPAEIFLPAPVVQRETTKIVAKKH